MPFTPTTNPPLTNPLVTVEFAGLILLSPGADNTCDIGIHRWAPTHAFQVMLIVNKPNRPSTLVRLIAGPLTGSLAIRLEPAPTHGDFQVFAATTAPFDRFNPQNNELDYRWTINLRDRHPGADINEGARPIVTLSTGLLYTPNLTARGLDPKLTKGTVSISLNRIAADLAAAIQPPTGGRVKLEWSEFGISHSLTLKRDEDPPGTTYTVSLINDPPIGSPTEHDELDLYYRVLTLGGVPIPFPDRWHLEYADDEKTDEIPCMPVTLEP
jgi:hypothetical protein